MNKLKLTLALALSISAAPALAANSKYEQAEIDQEIASCIAELAHHANYEDAAEVRHEIEVSKRRTIGHKLNIRTSVYSDSDDELIRAYASRCVVYRDNKPIRFRISELGDGA